MTSLNELYAYAAGVLDGEGCINLNKHKRQVVLRVQVANTNEDLIRLFESVFGGSVRRDLLNVNWKPRFTWTVSALKAEEFLRLVLPHLIVKKEQAELALAWRETIAPKGSRLSENTLSLRSELRGELTELNRRGTK